MPLPLVAYQLQQNYLTESSPHENNFKIFQLVSKMATKKMATFGAVGGWKSCGICHTGAHIVGCGGLFGETKSVIPFNSFLIDFNQKKGRKIKKVQVFAPRYAHGGDVGFVCRLAHGCVATGLFFCAFD